MEEKNTHDRTRKRKLQGQEGSSKRTRKNHDSDEEGSTKRTRSNYYSDTAGWTRVTRKNHDSDAEGSRYGTRKTNHHHDYDEEGSTKRTGKNHHDEWSTKGKRKNHDSDSEASMKETRKNYHYYDAESSTGRTRRNHHDYDAEGSRKETGKNYHDYDADSSTKRTRRYHHDYDAKRSRKETGKNYHDYDADSSTRRTTRNHHDYDAEGSTKETGKNYHEYNAEGSRKGTRKSLHAHDAEGSMERTRKNHDSDANGWTKGTGKNQDSEAAESTKGSRKNQYSDVSISGTSDAHSDQRHDDHVGGGRPYYDREQRYDSFERVYYCYPLSFVENKADTGTGNKIIMPEAALMPLLETRITMPMLFEIQNNSTGKVSHCGVLQFTGMEAEAIFLPEWMMKYLELELGDSVTLRNKSLEKGKKIKLQPHAMDFLAIRDPKAVLESNLQNFCCLTAGDTIMISHECKSFYINVLETEPGYAICITDTDCEVDFAPPLDYKEPEKRPVKEPVTTEQPKIQPFKRQLHEEPSTQGVEEKKQKFVPFTGKSNRLGGGDWKQEDWNTHPKFEGLDEEYSTVWPEEQEKQTKQVKFIPFTGASRHLDGESVSASSSSIPMTDKQPTTVAGGISMAVKPMFKPFMGISRRLDSA